MPFDKIQSGGKDRIVQIDEILISKKRKYHKGKWYPQIWLFGGIERKTAKWFAEVVMDRNIDIG